MLRRWDEQTYYSLAEASEKSHRKLSKLVTQYDEVLDVSALTMLCINSGRHSFYFSLVLYTTVHFVDA